MVDIRDVADYVNDKKRAAESQMQVFILIYLLFLLLFLL